MTCFFDRGSECLTLQFGRNAASYEVHVRHPDGTRTLEFVGTAEQLVDQIYAVPQALLAAGWHLRAEKPSSR